MTFGCLPRINVYSCAQTNPATGHTTVKVAVDKFFTLTYHYVVNVDRTV